MYDVGLQRWGGEVLHLSGPAGLCQYPFRPHDAACKWGSN